MARGDQSFRAFETSEKTPSVLVLFGSEPALVDGAARLLAERLARLADDTEIERADIAALAKDPSALLDIFDETPLFGGSRLLSVSGVGESHKKLVESLLDRAPPAPPPARVIIAAAGLKSKSALLDLARAHPHAAAIACHPTPLRAEEIDAAIARRGVQLADDDARRLLIERLSDLDPASVETVFDMLALYAEPGAALTATDVDAAAPAGVDAASFTDIARALASGAPDALINVLHAQRAVGVDPIAFQLALGRTLSDMSLSAAGERPFWPAREAFAALRRRAPDLRRRLDEASRALYALELRSRTSKALEPVELERLCVRLSKLLAA